MKTKEEVIKEAWGVGALLYMFMDKNGWLSERHLTNAQCYELNKNESIEYDNALGYRPKSLQGIENNNGWVKIESEDDLPKKEIEFWCMVNNRLVHLAFFDGDFFDESQRYKSIIEVTHYQPIVKPKKPLY